MALEQVDRLSVNMDMNMNMEEDSSKNKKQPRQPVRDEDSLDTQIRGRGNLSQAMAPGSGYGSGVRPQSTVYSLDLGDLDLGDLVWKPPTAINFPRRLHTVVSVGDYIYVFGHAGGGLNDPYNPDPDSLGEPYHVQNYTWEHLPKPPRLLYGQGYPSAHAVYHNCSPSHTLLNKAGFTMLGQTRISFCFHLWILPPPFMSSAVIPTSGYLIKVNLIRFCCPEVPDRLAVVDGVFIWHTTRSIYGYDLINRKYLGSLFTIPLDQQQLPPFYPTLLPPFDTAMFFLHQGDEDSLFQFFQNKCCSIHCRKFRIQKRTHLEEKYKYIIQPGEDWRSPKCSTLELQDQQR